MAKGILLHHEGAWQHYLLRWLLHDIDGVCLQAAIMLQDSLGMCTGHVNRVNRCI